MAGGAAVAGSAAAAVVLGATSAAAANGDPLLAGRANSASNTTALTNTSTVPTAQLTSTHPTSGAAHGLIVSVRNGYGIQGTSGGNHGVSGTTSAATKSGVIATHNGPAGSGAALIANGRQNTGAYVHNTSPAKPALLLRAAAGGTALAADGRVVVSAIGDHAALSVGTPPGTPCASFDTNGIGADSGAPIALLLSAQTYLPEEDRTVNGTALRAEGNVRVRGRVTCTLADTVIMDPNSPYVGQVQFLLEGSERRSVVEGLATIPAGADQVVVELPPWFAGLTTRHRHQLTPYDKAAPGLHVTAVTSTSFTVAGAPGPQRVGYLVTGFRTDVAV